MAVNFPPTFPDKKVLLSACAICANDCYYFDRKARYKSYVRELRELRMLEKENIAAVQYAVYRITRPGPHRNKSILAVRGTASKRSLALNLDLVDPQQILAHFLPGTFGEVERVGDGWSKVRAALDVVLDAVERLNPDYITGHSLGGLIAEVVASFTRTPGFSFNCPGPVALVTETSFLNPATGKWHGLNFEVHLREGDPIAHLNDSHHINSDIVWYSGTDHRMEELAKDIRGRKKRCLGCFGGGKTG